MHLDEPYFTLRVDYVRRLIHVVGEFDVATAECLATAIAGLQRGRRGDITIDLDRVAFIDAAGIGAIASARNAQTARGDRLYVTGATVGVQRIFGLVDQTELLRAS